MSGSTYEVIIISKKGTSVLRFCGSRSYHIVGERDERSEPSDAGVKLRFAMTDFVA